MKTLIDIEKGTVLLGREKFKSIIKNLENGQYLVHFTKISPKSKEEWRKYYFLLRDILYEDGETGYTKQQLHDLVKKEILMKLIDDNDNFNDDELDPTEWLSTSWLSEQGWQKFVKLFKEWSFEKFNCYL